MIPGLPYDHQLEYIESTGTQYVDSGLRLSSTGFKYEVSLEFTSTSNCQVFGGRTYADYSKVDSLSLFIVSGKWRFDYFGSTKTGPNISTGVKYTVSLQNGVTTVNGDSYGTSFTGGRTSGSTVNVFAGHIGNNTEFKASIKLYSLKIWQGDVLVMDYIPVSVNGVAMMYDRATGTFPKHYGTFVAGPVASTPLMGVHMYQAANLWKQPTMATWQSASPSTIWSPIPGVVYTSLADNGYSNSRFYDPFADGPDTIISIYSGGYCATVFLNLPPGNYVFKAKTDVNSNFRLLHYIPVETGWRISYGVNWGVKTAGKITYAFTIPQNEMIAVYFRAQNGGTIKTTDISITEAAS